jgi:hypothetical protein
LCMSFVSRVGFIGEAGVAIVEVVCGMIWDATVSVIHEGRHLQFKDVVVTCRQSLHRL